MNLVTRKEFAQMCGDDEKKINVYISRKKVSVSPENKKFIDTENPLNKAFMTDRQLQNELSSAGIETPQKQAKTTKKDHDKDRKNTGRDAVKSRKNVEKVVEKPLLRQKKTTEKPKKDPVSEAVPKEIRDKIEQQNARDQQRVDLENTTKRKNLEFIELKIKREELLLNKSAGELLPIDLVTGVVKRHTSSILKSFEKGVENIVSLVCGSDQTRYVQVMEDVKKELNLCVQTAGKQAQEELFTLVDDFSKTLLRGQKKV